MAGEGAEMVLLWCVFLRPGTFMVRFVALIPFLLLKTQAIVVGTTPAFISGERHHGDPQYEQTPFYTIPAGRWMGCL